MKMTEEYVTYEQNSLGGNPGKEAQLLKRILSEAAMLIVAEGMYPSKEQVQTLIREASLLQLRKAVQTLTGDAAIASTAKPVSWAEIITAGTGHPLLIGWGEHDQEKPNPWLPATTRFLWHVEAGLICATQKSTPRVKTQVVLEGTTARIFPWTQKNLLLDL